VFHWDLLFRTWRSKLMMIVFVYSSFHGSVLWFCIPFYFCSATKFATLYYKIQRPFPFYDIRMSKKFLQNFYNNSRILCIIRWIYVHIPVIPYSREQYKENCKENIIRIIFQRKGGLGNMRNIFVVRNINHSIDQWVVRGNKEMLFIVILLSHPDFRISDGLIARPIDSLKSSSHISYASCSAPSNIWSDASMIETDVFPFPIVCFHQLLIENI